MKGSGRNVTVACHHVRPPGPVPGRQGVGPLVGVDQSHSTISGPARRLAGPLPPSGLGDGRGLDLIPGPRVLLGCSSEGAHPHPFCPSPNSREINFLTLPTWPSYFSSDDYGASGGWTVSHWKVWVTGQALRAGKVLR